MTDAFEATAPARAQHKTPRQNCIPGMRTSYTWPEIRHILNCGRRFRWAA